MKTYARRFLSVLWISIEINFISFPFSTSITVVPNDFKKPTNAPKVYEFQPGTTLSTGVKAPASFERLFMGGNLTNTLAVINTARRQVATPERRLILTTLAWTDDKQAMEHMRDSAQNWMYHLNNIGRAQNALLIANNRSVCLMLWSVKVPCYLDRVSRWPRNVKVNETLGGPAALMKWYFTDLLVGNGFDVLYMDTDTVTLHDPFNEWDSSPAYDWMALSENSGVSQNRKFDQISRSCPMFEPGGADPMDLPMKLCASTSFFFAKSTEATKILTKAMIAAISLDPLWWEAKIFQRVALTFMWSEADSPHLQLKILDLAKFANTDVLKLRTEESIPTEQLAAMRVPLGKRAHERFLELSELGKWHPESWLKISLKGGHVTKLGYWENQYGVGDPPVSHHHRKEEKGKAREQAEQQHPASPLSRKQDAMVLAKQQNGIGPDSVEVDLGLHQRYPPGPDFNLNSSPSPPPSSAAMMADHSW